MLPQANGHISCFCGQCKMTAFAVACYGVLHCPVLSGYASISESYNSVSLGFYYI